MAIQRWMSLSMAIAMLVLGSCGTTPDSTAKVDDPGAVENKTVASTKEAENALEEAVFPEDMGYPNIGRITQAESGDIMCYTTVMDNQGQVFDIGATFEICDRSNALIDRTVKFIYSDENVADCQSAEPCGKSRRETLISDVVILGDSWQVLSNGKWTVTVGQRSSWDGTNGTGSLTYYGCDAQGNCLSLTNGITICRNGICKISWKNGDYAYTLSSKITENGDEPTTLRVWNNGKEIINSPGLKLVNSSY